MRNKKYNDLEVNQDTVSLATFKALYNKSVPESFPDASLKLLREFHAAHPTLFKGKDKWSIDRHRKRFMDWSFSNSRKAE